MTEQTAAASLLIDDEGAHLSGAEVKFHISHIAQLVAGTGIDDFFFAQFFNSHTQNSIRDSHCQYMQGEFRMFYFTEMERMGMINIK